MNHEPKISDRTVRSEVLAVEGLDIFYREAGNPGSPVIVLLHGFPASSHQYRNLIPALAGSVPRRRDGLPGVRQQLDARPGEVFVHVR
jgi:pimeloyl-ACP methyl ester carboxylesterase